MERSKKNNSVINEGVRGEERYLCLLCGDEGTLLYQDLRDRLFAAPGTWSVMRSASNLGFTPADGL